LEKAQIRALEKTTEALHTDIEQSKVMPRDTGALQNEKTFPDYSAAERGVTNIITEGPYARRLYYHPEYNFSTEENPNAQGEWFKDWLPGGDKEDFARKTFKKIYKEESGV
jgi:hypothetical protein